MTTPPASARTVVAPTLRGRRSLTVAAAAVLVVALAGCSGSDEGQTPATPAVAATTATTAATAGSASTAGSAPSTSSTASSPAADVVLTYTIASGKASPAFSQVQVSSGQTVSITVTSDVADELHVHGYDKEIELAPGTPATVSFTADQTGQFEIETHESGLRLAALVVR